jgi:hypothetical protein
VSSATDPVRSLAGRIGGLTLAATHDPHEYTAPARHAFLAQFEHQVDPEGTLLPAERARRAEAARKLYFARLALKSAQARRRASGRIRPEKKAPTTEPRERDTVAGQQRDDTRYTKTIPQVRAPA